MLRRSSHRREGSSSSPRRVRTMEATSPLVRPFAVLRPFARAGTAIALVLVMVISGGSLAFVTGGAGAASPSGGLAAAAVPTGVVQTGPQLQNDSYMENPGTPVSSLNNSTVLGNTSPNQQVTFTVGFEMRNAQALATIISEEETAGSGMYHQW